LFYSPDLGFYSSQLFFIDKIIDFIDGIIKKFVHLEAANTS